MIVFLFHSFISHCDCNPNTNCTSKNENETALVILQKKHERKKESHIRSPSCHHLVEYTSLLVFRPMPGNATNMLTWAILENHTFHSVPRSVASPWVHRRSGRSLNLGDGRHGCLALRCALHRTGRSSLAGGNRLPLTQFTLWQRPGEVTNVGFSWSWWSAILYPFSSKNEIRPGGGFLARVGFANDLAQGVHPLVLLTATVGVEVDCLTIGETETESFFHVLICLVFFCESRFPSSTSAGWVGGFRIGNQRSLVVNQSGSLSEIYDGSLLVCMLVISCEFRPL